VVLNQNVVTAAGGPTRVEKAKIAIIQFQLSAPKPDVRNSKSVIAEDIDSYADGQHCRHQRLSPNGQSHQRRPTVPVEHLQKDQKSKLQRAVDPKVYFA